MKVERIYTNDTHLEVIIMDLINHQIDQIVKDLYVYDNTTTSHDNGSVQS